MDGLEEGRLEEIFVIHQGWGQKGKGGRCSATELARDGGN